MEKSTKKYARLHKPSITILMEKYEVGYDFVWKSIAGDRTSVRALAIKEDYPKIKKVFEEKEQEARELIIQK